MRKPCNPLKCAWGCFVIPQRVVLALLLHMAMQNAYNLRVVLNVAITVMIERTNATTPTKRACPNFAPINSTATASQFEWPRWTESLILYAFFGGYFISHFLGGYLVDKYGGRWVIGICSILSLACNLIFPVCVIYGGFIAASIVRFFLGIAQGPIYPACAGMISLWIPAEERTVLGAIAYSGGNLGMVIGSAGTGLVLRIANEYWPAAFYFWGCVCGLYLCMHFLWCYSSPDSHKGIFPEEKEKIDAAIPPKKRFKVDKVFWKKLFTNIPFYANLSGHFAHNWMLYTICTFLPTYLKEILQLDIQSNGLYSSLPFVGMWLMSVGVSNLAHYLVDTKGCMSRLWFNKIIGTMSNVGSAAAALAAVIVGCNRAPAIAFFVLAMIFKGFAYMSIAVNTNEITKNYGGIVFGIINGISALSGVIGGALFGAITADKTLIQWRLTFMISLGLTIVLSIFYVLGLSSTRQPFDAEEGEEVDEKGRPITKT